MPRKKAALSSTNGTPKKSPAFSAVGLLGKWVSLYCRKRSAAEIVRDPQWVVAKTVWTVLPTSILPTPPTDYTTVNIWWPGVVVDPETIIVESTDISSATEEFGYTPNRVLVLGMDGAGLRWVDHEKVLPYKDSRIDCYDRFSKQSTSPSFVRALHAAETSHRKYDRVDKHDLCCSCYSSGSLVGCDFCPDLFCIKCLRLTPGKEWPEGQDLCCRRCLSVNRYAISQFTLRLLSEKDLVSLVRPWGTSPQFAQVMARNRTLRAFKEGMVCSLFPERNIPAGILATINRHYKELSAPFDEMLKAVEADLPDFEEFEYRGTIALLERKEVDTVATGEVTGEMNGNSSSSCSSPSSSLSSSSPFLKDRTPQLSENKSQSQTGGSSVRIRSNDDHVDNPSSTRTPSDFSSSPHSSTTLARPSNKSASKVTNSTRSPNFSSSFQPSTLQLNDGPTLDSLMARSTSLQLSEASSSRKPQSNGKYGVQFEPGTESVKKGKRRRIEKEQSGSESGGKKRKSQSESLSITSVVSGKGNNGKKRSRRKGEAEEKDGIEGRKKRKIDRSDASSGRNHLRTINSSKILDPSTISSSPSSSHSSTTTPWDPQAASSTRQSCPPGCVSYSKEFKQPPPTRFPKLLCLEDEVIWKETIKWLRVVHALNNVRTEIAVKRLIRPDQVWPGKVSL